jgi:hypothetical protein
MVAAVHMHDLAGDAAGPVGQQEDASLADFLDTDRAPERRIVLVPFQDIAEIADAGGRQRLDRPGRNGVDANLARTKIYRQRPHAGFQRGLGDTHDVVMRHDLFGAVIGQRQ